MNLLTTNQPLISTFNLWEKLNQFRVEEGSRPIRHDDFLARVIDEIDDLPLCENFAHPQNKQLMRYYNLNADQSLLVGMRESKVVRKKVLAWIKELTKPKVPQTKLEWIEFALEQEKQLELKTKKVEQLESLFHNGGTIAQFAKQMNGVNSQQVNNWLYANTNWLYDENKGKIHLSGRKQGLPKPASWRCAAYARDKYLTETNYNLDRQGMESIVKYEVQLLADGKKWLFDKYIAGKLPMKSDWNGEFTHKKDLV